MKKLTHDNYLKLLLVNNIKVIPLEKYILSQTKILHRCECGIEWSIQPYSILQGNKCGCQNNKSKKHSHQEYLQKLQNNNIKVIPLEEYNGSHTKILHKCKCGNKWKVEPTSVLANRYCGCGNISNQLLRYKNRKTILYYIKVNNLYKIGITMLNSKFSVNDNILKSRFKKDVKNGVSIKILKTYIFKNGSEAFLKEQQILNEFKKYKYIKKDMKWFGGYTELFKKDIYEGKYEFI